MDCGSAKARHPCRYPDGPLWRFRLRQVRTPHRHRPSEDPAGYQQIKTRMIGRHLCVVPYVSFTQRNIFFQLFRRSLIYIRLRLNNSKNTFGQVKDYVSTIRHPYFQIRQGYFQIRAGYWKISGSYSKLNATYCKLRAFYFEISAF